MSVPATTTSYPRSPSLYYGWTVVAVAFLTLLVSLGIRFTFSIFVVPLTREFGWDRASTSGIFSVSLLLFAVIGPALGYVLDRFGAPRLFVGGSLILAVGLGLSATAASFTQMMLYYGIIASIGLGALSLGIHSVVLSRWFVRRRGLAIGLAFAGTGLGTLVFSPLAERLIDGVGWREAYLVLGAIALLLLAPANALWARTRPQDMRLLPDGDVQPAAQDPPALAPTIGPAHTARSVLKHRPFWMMVAATFLAMVTVRMILIHAVVHLVDVGFTSLFAATVLGAVGAVQAPATVTWGWLSDRLGRVWAFSLGSVCVLAAAIFLLLVQAEALPLYAWLFALMFGLGDASRVSLLNAQAADLFEGPEYGMINGFILSAFGLGGALGPWLGGYLFDLNGNYDLAFSLGIAATLLATLAFSLGGRGAPRHHRDALRMAPAPEP